MSRSSIYLITNTPIPTPNIQIFPEQTLLFSRRNRLDAGGAAAKYDGWFVGMRFGYRF